METNSQTLIVVMPVYNSEKTLDAAIFRVLNQSYRNLLLFIVDDCSSDSSLSIAKNYLSDSRVMLFKNNKNRGAYYSRNVGLYYAKKLGWGYFTTHDSDDVSFWERYLKLITLLEKSEDAIAIQDRFQRVDLHTGKNLRDHITSAHALFKREVFDGIGYFDSVRFGADWEHWERCEKFAELHNKKCLTLDELVGQSFIHENNLTVKIPGRSKQRKEYVARSKAKIKSMTRVRRWHRDFKFLGSDRVL
jgi:glycosyltransferase involved in cell wall biosynthesis